MQLKLQEKMIISVKKSRKIDLSEISLTGNFISVKNNTHIEFESQLERDYIYLLEFDSKVEQYIEQPLRLEYFDSNNRRFYTPDFYIKYLDGTEIVVEIKQKKDLEENFHLYKKKFKAMEDFCLKNNMAFYVKTELDFPVDVLFNAKFLIPYKNPVTKPNSADEELLLYHLRRYEKICINLLLDVSCRTDEKRAELIFTLWHLLANDLVGYDQNNKLNMESIIWAKI